MVNVINFSTTTDSKPNQQKKNNAKNTQLRQEAKKKPVGLKDVQKLLTKASLKTQFEEKRRICRNKCCNLKRVITTFKDFLRRLPSKFRCMYVGAFLAHAYRPEWGKFIQWDPHTPVRRKEEIEEKKKRKQARRERLNKRSKSSRRILKTLTDAPPKPLPHDHSHCRLVRINVAGRIFQSQLRTLNQFPHTLLGDKKRRMQYFDPARNEFFFDRHRTSFEAILTYFQTGGSIIRKPSGISWDIFLEECKFYDLGPDTLKYLDEHAGGAVDEDRSLPSNLFQRKIWLLFDCQESSYQSRIVAYLSILAVCLSIIEFSLETIPDFCWQKEPEPHSPSNPNPNEESEAVQDFISKSAFDLRDPFFLTETICVIFFVFEYVIRALTSPHLLEFVRNFANVVDLVSIIPYFVNLAQGKYDESRGCDLHASVSRTDSFTVFRIVRLVRVFRILKLSRHNKGLKILGKTLRASIRELGLFMFFIVIGIIVFSSAIYFVESGATNDEDSIPKWFWFSIVTLTTLGYGDIVPLSYPGKLVGSMCAIAGVLAISLPVPVIVSNFNAFNVFYKREANRKKFSSYDHVKQCPYLPMEGGQNIREKPPEGDEDSEFEELKKKGNDC